MINAIKDLLIQQILQIHLNKSTMELFSVHYQLKIAIQNNGEFSNECIMRSETMTNTSNFLPEILTDIYDKHRHEWLIGVEIQDVKPFHPNDVSIAEFINAHCH